MYESATSHELRADTLAKPDNQVHRDIFDSRHTKMAKHPQRASACLHVSQPISLSPLTLRKSYAASDSQNYRYIFPVYFPPN